MNAPEHYTKWNDAYLHAYGGVLQAYRCANITDMLNQIGQTAKLGPGLEVLDCGGGYGYPAAFFSANFNVKVTSLNVTQCQLDIARREFGHLVDFRFHDFEKIVELGRKFDRILFLETFGHSKDVSELLRSCEEVLKPGGLVFIKHGSVPEHVDEFKKLEEFYSYRFYSREKVVRAALDADLLIEEVKLTNYGTERCFDYAEKFKSLALDEPCFEFVPGYRYEEFQTVDYLFRKPSSAL